MNTLNLLQVERALQTIARVSRENEKYFCDLDGEMGDADFGKSIWGGFRAVVAELPSIDRADIGTFLIKVGTVFASHAGGTSGPIWGTAFLKAGLKAKGKTELTTADLLQMGRAAQPEDPGADADHQRSAVHDHRGSPRCDSGMDTRELQPAARAGPVGAISADARRVERAVAKRARLRDDRTAEA